ncbi:MAG: class I ribonucleotide reductase maintenance protein YfaE [Serratia proteamaculans]|jgi:ferredoxin|uniref:2Fe-2S ferredoxin-like protein n=1 Tax=Serratia proteamaculans TaxID=28151 RepID=A0A7U0RM31_SERPR|nr:MULTISPECIES: class I ribonucleotide reductase maintenance protein YfaE [Serratia]HCV67165.1 2Fe-2S ferredoxin-like protein [Serratia sp. (in: enterobacteria)]MBO1503970.1 2Fe-2S ferredoxin-like protein [Serratia proteamaculans]MDW5510399.1 class I ribonucleotide reductase maintenance protein YfaE [Serratia proteamaculans]QQX52126.1 2Fe-2S ferredoxin-like protein [Serratia proteamaculans]WEO88091.1 class I ribonucleotide reductase maintenance protein YfaE [Serratia proteamaculans]
MALSIVTLRATGTQLSCPKSEGCLLDVLELHDVEVEYQCRSGYCGACRLKLVKGEVVYHQQPLAFINDGEILPCCCMPLTDIELEL